MVDIVSILQSHERVNIEVKAAKGGIPNSIWETYSSFANTFGGTIILGIEEDKSSFQVAWQTRSRCFLISGTR